jgi:FtsP/CotA-like multicopper oxidase with cupredoxin domain
MSTFQFSVDNHTMSVIEADSTMVEPTNSTRLDIAIAERFSVVVTTDQLPGNYWIRATINTNCFAFSNPVLDAGVKGILTYTNSEDDPLDQFSVGFPGSDDPSCVDFNATALVPAVAQQAPPADVLYNIQFSFGIGAYALDRAYINGTSWTPLDTPTLNTIVPALRAGNQTFNKPGVASYGLSDQYIVDIPEYQVVDILLTNFDENAHPFHFHGHQFWVMGTSAEEYFPWDTYGSLNTTNPARKDTIVIAPYGWVLLRFVSDNPGLWALHCHIAWHMEAGLLMQFQARNDLMKDWVIPSDVLDLCNV